MRALPPMPFEACRIVSTSASSLSLVRFDNNDYSIPTRCAHHEVIVKGSCDRVRIYQGHTLVSEHGRCWEKEQICYNPVHYLALLERKPGALDFAKPFEKWNLPESLHRLRGHLEAAHGEQGKRDYISILRLLEKHPLDRLGAAVEMALKMGCANKALIEQHLYHEDRETKVFTLEGRDHLKGVRVASTDPSAYQALLPQNKKEVA